jgi:hypothetical protein
MIPIKYRPGIVHGVKYRLKVIAPLVHLGVDFCGSIGVGLPVIDRLVAEFDYQSFDLGMANKELQKHQSVIRSYEKISKTESEQT